MTAPRPRRSLALVTLLALGVAWLAAPAAHAIHDVTITTPVTDVAGVLSPADEERVAARLVAYREATGVQLAVVLVDSTDAPITDWANRVFRSWGGGSKERNDGALFVLAIRDRTNRLELGYGLEGHISDGMALDMLVELRPLLREARYADATLQLIDAVWAATSDITPAAPIGAPLSRSPWFYLGMMLVALAGGASWLARLGAASKADAHLAQRGKKKGKGKGKKGSLPATADGPSEAASGVASKRARRIRTLIEVLALFVVAPVLLMILVQPGMEAPFPWFVAWTSWVLIGVMGVAFWQYMPIGRWFWLIPAAAGTGLIVYLMLTGAGLEGASAAHAAGNLLAGPEDVYRYSLIPLAVLGFWAGMVGGAGAPSSGGSSSGSSYRSSSSSYSSSSSSSSRSSSSRSSSWSGGGGSSGGGGASSSW